LIFHFFLCWLFAAISDIAPSHPHNVFFFFPSIHLYPCIDAILGAELLWCVVFFFFPAGHVTGLCYLKLDAALGGVGGGVIILQCY